MIDWTWITTTGTDLLMVLLSGAGIYAALLVLTLITGLRSFSKMSSFDFAVTVALSSVVASTVLAEDPPILIGAFGLVVLYGLQFLLFRFRRLTTSVERLVDNETLVVMARSKVLFNHLDQTRMPEDDLRLKLRMAGVTHPRQVLAVIFETTGDVSVITTSDDVDPWLFEDVRGAEKIPALSV